MVTAQHNAVVENGPQCLYNGYTKICV